MVQSPLWFEAAHCKKADCSGNILTCLTGTSSLIISHSSLANWSITVSTEVSRKPMIKIVLITLQNYIPSPTMFATGWSTPSSVRSFTRRSAFYSQCSHLHVCFLPGWGLLQGQMDLQYAASIGWLECLQAWQPPSPGMYTGCKPPLSMFPSTIPKLFSPWDIPHPSTIIIHMWHWAHTPPVLQQQQLLHQLYMSLLPWLTNHYAPPFTSTVIQHSKSSMQHYISEAVQNHLPQYQTIRHAQTNQQQPSDFYHAQTASSAIPPPPQHKLLCMHRITPQLSTSLALPLPLVVASPQATPLSLLPSWWLWKGGKPAPNVAGGALAGGGAMAITSGLPGQAVSAGEQQQLAYSIQTPERNAPHKNTGFNLHFNPQMHRQTESPTLPTPHVHHHHLLKMAPSSKLSLSHTQSTINNQQSKNEHLQIKFIPNQLFDIPCK